MLSGNWERQMWREVVVFNTGPSSGLFVKLLVTNKSPWIELWSKPSVSGGWLMTELQCVSIPWHLTSSQIDTSLYASGQKKKEEEIQPQNYLDIMTFKLIRYRIFNAFTSSNSHSDSADVDCGNTTVTFCPPPGLFSVKHNNDRQLICHPTACTRKHESFFSRHHRSRSPRFSFLFKQWTLHGPNYPPQ